MPIDSQTGLDPGAGGTYPILGDPSTFGGGGLPAATGSGGGTGGGSGGGGLINDVMQAANQLGAGQAIDLLKGLVMPAIMQGVQQGAAGAPGAAAALPGAASALPGAAAALPGARRCPAGRRGCPAGCGRRPSRVRPPRSPAPPVPRCPPPPVPSRVPPVRSRVPAGALPGAASGLARRRCPHGRCDRPAGDAAPR